MPIRLPEGLRRLSDEESSRAAYRVMEVVFKVHNEFGRLFDEGIYTAEIGRRLGAVARTEVKVEVHFESFCKPYYVDLLYDDGALFEFKAAETFVERHRAQVLHYLFLLDLAHGKLVNFRSESVEHEFVNAPLARADRTNFLVVAKGFSEKSRLCVRFQDLLVAMLRDWGTCLETSLYEEAVTHFFGGEKNVLQDVAIISAGNKIGNQKLRLLTPDTAFKITGFEGERPRYETGLRQLLSHTPLKHLHWVNVGRRTVTFKTL